MNGITTAYSVKILDHMFNKAAYASDTNFHVGLSTTTIDPNGQNITEPVGGAYIRTVTTNLNWNSAVAGTTPLWENYIDNATPIDFAKSTAPWGTVTDMFIANAATGIGSVVLCGAVLTAAKTIETDTIAVFLAGDLKLVTKNT